MAVYLKREGDGGYKTHAGRIVSPGKFEGEPAYVPYFWGLGLNGGSDCDDYGPSFCFNINDEDKRKWPQLANRVRLELWEDSNGFVWHCFRE